MLQPFILSSEKFQLFAGLVHLTLWLTLMPFFLGKFIGVVRWMNEPMAAWQLKGAAIIEGFFATICILGAATGAVLLAVLTVAKAGLIASPWSAA